MGAVLAVVNQKGGVGKSTTCVNLAAALTELRQRVLVIDLDPQGNTTSGLGVDKSSDPSVYPVLLGQSPARDAIVVTPYCHVLPANKTLSGAEIELVGLEHRESLLREALVPLLDAYDVVLIDCPPSLSLLTINALCACQGVLVPVQCEYYALEGLSDLIYSLRAVKKNLNPQLEITGILLTMFDARTGLSMQVAREIKQYFPRQVFGVSIPRNVRLSEAPSHGMPVLAYDSHCKGAAAYRKLAKELRKRLKKKPLTGTLNSDRF